MPLTRPFFALLTLACLPLWADSAPAAAQLCTLQGQVAAPERYGSADASAFTAGNRFIPAAEEAPANVPLKGVAYFDLEQAGLRGQLAQAGNDRVFLSFILQKVIGSPYPLRVEYIGVTDDKDSETSRARQFQAAALHSVGQALEAAAEPGLKVIDVTSLLAEDLSAGRWLVIRFEQDTPPVMVGQNALYQFNPAPASVRLTLSTDSQGLQAVVNAYQSAGQGALLPDRDGDRQPDLPPTPVPAMSKSLIPVKTIILGGQGNQPSTIEGAPLNRGPAHVQGGVVPEENLLPGLPTEQVGTGNSTPGDPGFPGTATSFTGDSQSE